MALSIGEKKPVPQRGPWARSEIGSATGANLPPLWRDIAEERAELIMADSREVMNIRQASQYLGVSPDTLYKYVYEERIPAFKLGNRWKFKKTILDSWMERKSSAGEGRGKKRPKAMRSAAGH